MGKQRRRKTAPIRNVISPRKGVEQVRESVRHLYPRSKISLARLISLHSSRQSSSSLVDAATGIPSDLPVDDFVALHDMVFSKNLLSASSLTLIETRSSQEGADLPSRPGMPTPGRSPSSFPPETEHVGIIPDSDPETL